MNIKLSEKKFADIKAEVTVKLVTAKELEKHEDAICRSL